MNEILRSAEGEMAEGYDWHLTKDMEGSNQHLRGIKPCRHCVDIVDHGKYQTWRVPFVAVAYNEGGCNSTELCAECVKEALEGAG